MTDVFDWTVPGANELAAEKIKEQLDEACARPAKYSYSIKPSAIGDDCIAKNWLEFRWCGAEAVEGRNSRLFKTGGDREQDMVPNLRKAGWTVFDVDPERVAAGHRNQQYKMTDFSGHMKGYADGFGSHPYWTGGAVQALEFKTYNTKRFSALTRSKIKTDDPKYYGQVTLYMRFWNVDRTFFLAENKNDSDYHLEVIERDDSFAEEMNRRAHTILYSNTIPSRVASSPTYFKCKFCHLKEKCHNGAPVDKNCRSCAHAEPIEGAQWRCNKWGATIPSDEAIRAGCDHHLPVHNA